MFPEVCRVHNFLLSPEEFDEEEFEIEEEEEEAPPPPPPDLKSTIKWDDMDEDERRGELQLACMDADVLEAAIGALVPPPDQWAGCGIAMYEEAIEFIEMLVASRGFVDGPDDNKVTDDWEFISKKLLNADGSLNYANLEHVGGHHFQHVANVAQQQDMRAAIDLLQVSKIETDIETGRSFTIRFRDGTKTEMRVPLVSPADKKKGGGKKVAADALLEDETPPAQVVSQWVELLSGGGGSAQFE